MSNNKTYTPLPRRARRKKSLSTSHHTGTLNQPGGNPSGHGGSGQPSDSAGGSGSQSGGNQGGKS